MQSTSYEYSARSNQIFDRPRLFSGWALSGFALAVLIPLVLIFPKQELMRQASLQKLGDVLTINYLSNLLKTEPDNLELRLLLAEHWIYIGETRGVSELIQPAINSPDPTWQAKGLLTEYKNLTMQISSSPKGSAQLRALIAHRQEVFLRVLWRPWSVPTLVYLAGQADQMEEKAIAAQLYTAIEDASASESVDWFASVAARVLGEGQNKLAAHLYFIARHKANSLSEQRDFFLAGVHALMSASLFKQAMQSIDRNLGNLSDDRDTLYSLTLIARAADDQSRAVRYAKQLLRISRTSEFFDWIPRLDLALFGISSAYAAPSTIVEGGSEIRIDAKRPYDRKSFLLAYEVFLGNHKHAEAYQVAASAVRQEPKNKVWHQRLAQVAEWTNKPQVALREWVWLMRNGGGEASWMAVLRLAPSLNDYDALLAAWKHIANKLKMDEAQWKNLGDLFEQAGRQREGIEYFERSYKTSHRPLHLEIAARLAERSGDDGQASRLYRRLLEGHGFNFGWILSIANLHLRKGEFQKTYDLLQKNRANIDEKNVAYFKLMADLAWQLQKDDDATRNYRQLVESGNLTRDDFSRLIFLLGDSRREEQATLAEIAYRRFGDRDMLLLALENYANERNRLAQQRLYEGIETENIGIRFSDSARFFLLRAQYHQANRDFQLARADFRHAVDIAPDDSATGNAILWFLIDTRDVAVLREMLTHVVARGDHKNPAYWGALAAAYQVLEQPSHAVAYYTRQIKREGQDFLWLVNYADALDQNQQTIEAARVRRHAWSQLRNRLADNPPSLPFTQEMQAAARLAMLNFPADQSMALVRSVLRQDRLAKRDVVIDRTTNELVLGWAMSKESSVNAKTWLWQRYGRSLETPLWAEVMVAVEEQDSVKIESLLAEQAERLPILARHDAAVAAHQIPYAQTIAFDGLTNQPSSDEIHLRLKEDVLVTSSHLSFEVKEEKIGNLHRFIQNFQIETTLAKATRLAVEFGRTQQSNETPSTFGAVPSAEKITGLSLKNIGRFGDTEIAMRHRNEFSRTSEIQLAHEMSLIPRIKLRLGWDVDAAATESNELHTFGMCNQLKTGLTYVFSKREYLRLEPIWVNYFTQRGEYLGHGNHFSWELAHQVRTEYPDWKVRLIGIHTRFSPELNPVFTLPANANVYGGCFGVGNNNRNVYTRTWRPYWDSCATHNDQSGVGYNASFGISGSVAGPDHLSISLKQEWGGVNITGGLSQVLIMSYRYTID